MKGLIDKLNSFLASAGYSLLLLAKAVRYLPRIPFRWKAVVREMWIIGVQSLPLVCFFLFLIGMVFALQVGMGLIPLGQEEFVGAPVAFGMVRELGPWMTAFVLVARNGSSMAAEVGTMAVSDEISALRIMSIRPEDFIVMPRLFAFVFVAPILTVIGTAVGIFGGMIVANVQFSVPNYVYLNTVQEWIKPPLAMYWSLVKAMLFATTAATIACSFGLRARGGALGVGKASRDTVVYSLVLVVLLNFMMTSMYTLVSEFFEDTSF